MVFGTADLDVMAPGDCDVFNLKDRRSVGAAGDLETTPLQDYRAHRQVEHPLASVNNARARVDNHGGLPVGLAPQWPVEQREALVGHTAGVERFRLPPHNALVVKEVGDRHSVGLVHNQDGGGRGSRVVDYLEA